MKYKVLIQETNLFPLEVEAENEKEAEAVSLYTLYGKINRELGDVKCIEIKKGELTPEIVENDKGEIVAIYLGEKTLWEKQTHRRDTTNDDLFVVTKEGLKNVD